MSRRFRFAVILLCLSAASLLAQDTSVRITDDKGNFTVGHLSSGGNVSFLDNFGNLTVGTIRDGNVFLTGKDTIIGTVKDGNVFLTGQDGTTTGTIRDGYVFLSHSDGSTTTGTYQVTEQGASMYTTRSGGISRNDDALRTTREQNLERQRRIQEENYQAGQAIGYAIGQGLIAIIHSAKKRKINSFCREHPNYTYVSGNTAVPCPNAPTAPRGWSNSFLEKAVNDIHPQMLASFVQACTDTPKMYRDHHERLLHEEDDRPFLEESQKALWRAIVSSEPPVPASWRIESAEDFQECLNAQETDWQGTLILVQKYPEYFQMCSTQTNRACGDMAGYLQTKFGETRFLVYTLPQREEAYWAVKSGWKPKLTCPEGLTLNANGDGCYYAGRSKQSQPIAAAPSVAPAAPTLPVTNQSAVQAIQQPEQESLGDIARRERQRRQQEQQQSAEPTKPPMD